MQALPRLAVICPVFNEEAVIPLFFARLKPVLDGIAARYETHVVFLNNASTDGSLDAVAKLRAAHPNVFVLSLSKNCGYQRSVECGLRNAQGDLFVVIDVDCEDPPEMIPRFLELIEEGNDIVYGERVDRPEGAFLKGMRKLFYRVTRAIADEDIILDMAEFAMITREVRDAIAHDTNSFPFIRASIGRVGFRRVGVAYRREPRIAGTTHYNFIGMTLFAIAGILSSSTLLLRLPAYAFPFWAALVAGLGWAYGAHGDRCVLATLIVVVALYLGATVMAVSIYVARLYKNTLGRPNFILDTRHCALQPPYAGGTLVRRR
ncbi:glycosyltransferase family 2 protein [Usitatibacter palustris]|uniref:Prophage bactoprenol glucosyl transferase n=1 Tax=Usitatibacter palustris TaxID=2732487 RepID=A0A6M4HD83_9PROT|nr:glycosyltransferase family 2 protein [Usitatibacter palustris]QJR16514.1 Prophage bactoprenol glucosyl transferase [Usitatibacter palustris]